MLSEISGTERRTPLDFLCGLQGKLVLQEVSTAMVPRDQEVGVGGEGFVHWELSHS